MATSSHQSVLRLLPGPTEQIPLQGLYLAQDLRSRVRDGRAYCFSNFVVSLDGRISLPSTPGGSPSGVPRSLGSFGDWRLFQELVAQSDAVLVSGRYVREVASGHAQPLVQLDRPGMEDLVVWRESAGLPPVPDVVVLSSSLEFDPEAAFRLGPRITVVTSETGPSERKEKLRAAGMDVVLAGEERVEGPRLADVLFESGYQLVYIAAGPRVFHLVVGAGILDRLFVTTVSQLLGGHRFATLTEGEAFQPPAELHVDALYLDSESHSQVSQLFAVYAASASP